ncbi:MAG: DoxX family protein [Bacteroidota bacterium]
MKNTYAIGTWVLRLLAAIIMLQTLYFKFSAAEESVYIFSTLGMEPWGRIGIGIMELAASILILYPRTTPLGALLGLGLMSGALFFHVSKLGIVVMDDGGQLFIYALIVFISCFILAFMQRQLIIGLARKLLKLNP